MVNINRNSALETLQKLVEQSFTQSSSYMPDSFNEKQQMALELFKQRIFLEEVIEESLDFNKNLNWVYESKNLKLINSAEELMEVYKLRSDIYTKINYQNEFPDTIEGLNFDLFDKSSAILYSKTDGNISGTIKVVFDTKNKLPSENKISFNHLRTNNQIVELSRFVVKNVSKGLNQDFKYLFAGVYHLARQNGVDLILSSIREDHYKMYTKFGGVSIERNLDAYGHLDVPFLVLAWNPAEVSTFFNRAFLNVR